MASVLVPQPIFHGHSAVFDPETLLDHLWLRKNLRDHPVTQLPEVVNETDCEYAATPMQEEIVHSGYPQWCKLVLALPTSPSPTIDRIDATWRILSARHPCLRTLLYARPQDGKIYHRVMKRISSPRQDSDFMTSSRSYEEQDNETAFLTISNPDDQEQITAVTLNIRVALVDVTSMGALKIDFAFAYCGLPIRDTTPMTAYLRHIQEGPKTDRALKFWRAKFDKASVTRIVPKASSSPLARTDKHHSISMKLESQVLQQLSDLETHNICTRKCLFEALWATVLSKRSATQDIVFASAERDRSFDGYAKYVGSLDQTYPVRVSLTEGQSFASLAVSLDEFHTEASSHAHLGHEAILKTSNLPCPESVLRYSNTIGSPSVAGSITHFPLIMFVNDYQPVKLTLFHTARLSVGDAKLILQHYANAIRDTLSKLLIRRLTVDEIELTSYAERNFILHGATTSTSSEQTRPSHIAKLFETQVRSHPTDPAVQYENDKPITFRELNQFANQLAGALQIKSRAFIPVCMDRSVDLIACLMAILKSGAAYVILDPEGAPERNARIVEDCEAEIVLTNRQYASYFSQACIIEDLRGFRDEGNLPLEYSVAETTLIPDDPCYIIYTSGSTGVPKGVVLSHRAATSGMSHFSLNGRRRWLLFYNPIFSAAQRVMLATLVKGGCLLLASKRSLTTSLGQTINSMRADALGITPSALSLLSPRQVPTLKLVTLVGEQVSQALVDKWCERVELRNTYGLSECTQLNFGTRLSTGSDPRVVGRPSDSTSAFILKAGSTELAPLEVTGELCLAGPQLGEGYLKKPEQTAKVFVQNPFGPGKLYRTGDAARQLRDGAILIAGRLDFQVKINGQRTEPSEVNEALLKHSGVQACATVAALMNGSTALVVAVVPANTKRFNELVTELRGYAKKMLPSYMIPSYWLRVDQLPTNANGKIDVSHITSTCVL